MLQLSTVSHSLTATCWHMTSVYKPTWTNLRQRTFFFAPLFFSMSLLYSLFFSHNLKHTQTIPLLDVYRRAAWKHASDVSAKFSSIDTWTAKPESGFTLARDSRSVERTKKLPWNVWMDIPVGQSEK